MFIPDSQTLVTNINDLGVFGDGVTNVTTPLLNALNGLTSGQAVWMPAGIYMVNASILYPGNIKLFGSGDSDGGTVIKVIQGTNLTTPVLCSKDWYNNATTSGNPVEISDIQIDGNNTTSGANAHGFVSMNFWSSFDRMTIKNVSGDGFRFTAHSQNGTHISNTCVEAKIRRIQSRNNGGNGIYINDSGSPLNSCTDGFLEDCIVQNAGLVGILNEMGPGWFIQANHVYGTGQDGIQTNKCYATRIWGNYIDNYGSGSASFIAGIGASLINGRASSIIGNHIGFETATAAGPYQALRATGNGTNTTVVTIAHNTVKGGSQSGSIGYVIQTTSQQRSSPYIVYFHDNDARNVATSITEDSHTTGGDLSTFGHIGSISQNAPTAVAGANAGTTPPSPVLANCTDVAGQITFGTGTTPAAGDQVDVTFYTAYSNAPKVLLMPINGATQALGLFVSSTTTGFSVSCNNAPSASQANTVYGFNYGVYV